MPNRANHKAAGRIFLFSVSVAKPFHIDQSIERFETQGSVDVKGVEEPRNWGWG